MTNKNEWEEYRHNLHITIATDEEAKEVAKYFKDTYSNQGMKINRRERMVIFTLEDVELLNEKKFLKDLKRLGAGYRDEGLLCLKDTVVLAAFRSLIFIPTEIVALAECLTGAIADNVAFDVEDMMYLLHRFGLWENLSGDLLLILLLKSWDNYRVFAEIREELEKRMNIEWTHPRDSDFAPYIVSDSTYLDLKKPRWKTPATKKR